MSAANKTISIAVAINEPFLMPLMVMLRSACRNLSKGWAIEVFVFGYRLSTSGRAELESGVQALPVAVHWKTLDLSSVENYWPGLHRPGDITCYYRLFLGEVLPQSVERVLFLDTDVLVEGNLVELWELPFEGNVVQAVPDAYAPTQHLPRLSQIEFDEGIQFTSDTPYFNAGVQLIDLNRWRQKRIGQRAGALLWKYGEQLRFRDQDALNCVLVGRWQRLEPTWNLHELAEHPATWNDSGATGEQLQRAWQQPAIIHYIGWKPWSPFWRPHRSELWWNVAYEAGVPKVRRMRHIAIWDALFSGPHTRVRWHARRLNWSRAALQIIAHPWTLVTYPLWRLLRR
jgi:lipopolysaccharide biosynthesis glycosyltransferase